MNDHMKDYAKSIVQGWPYEKLWKKSHVVLFSLEFTFHVMV